MRRIAAVLAGALALLLAGCETYRDNTTDQWDQRAREAEGR